MPKIQLPLFLLLAVQSCEKESISPNLAQKSQGITHEEPLKCLEPYNGPLRELFIKDHGIHERLAVPESGHQSMGHGTPWREFALEPVPAKFFDNEIAFAFSASCELIYAPEGVTDASFIVLPEIRRTIYFEKGASESMILNEKKSDLTLREFQILTNTQLEFGTEFWEVYGKDIDRIAQGSERESVRAWIDSNYSESWAIPDKIRIALSR